MENLALKIKLSALWIAGMLNGLVGGLLELFEPGVLTDIIDGKVGGMEITHELLLFMAILMVIPPIMVFLSLTLEGAVNRWTNIIVGLFFTGFSLVEMIGFLEKTTSAYYIVISIVGIVFAALIVWYAWKWPKKEA